MIKSDARLKSIWNQREIPVVLRRAGKGEKLRARVPYAADNRSWLGGCGRSSPERNKRHACWELPKAWFNEFVNRALKRFGRVYIIQPYHEHETCAPACLNAKGHECECSCMGRNHGHGNDGSWFEVSETFAVRSGERHLACRLLTMDTSPLGPLREAAAKPVLSPKAVMLPLRQVGHRDLDTQV